MLRRSRLPFRRTQADTAISVAEGDVRGVTSRSSAPQDAFPLSSGSSANHDHYGAARSPISYSAIDSLTRFLSPENLASDYPLIYSPTAIRSFYYRAESRSQLGMLDSRMLTYLMSLFGSLSIYPRTSIVYRAPLTSRFLESSVRRTHWAFVLKVGRYKLENGMHLQDSDRFWLMHAELATVQAKPPSEPLSSDVYNAILRARTHYHVIRRHSRHPEVHVHYLETLLAIRDPRLLNFVPCDLAFLLRTHPIFHPRLQRLLHRLVIQYGRFLSTQSQEAVLDALWSRAFQGTGGITDLAPENGLLGTALDDCILDATSIARSLSTTLFGPASRLLNHKSMNPLGQLFSVFSPAYTLSLRWGSLNLFSIFNSSEILHFNGIQWTCDHAIPQATSCWQVIFGLATIEKILQEPPRAPSMQPSSVVEILATTRTLYQLWLPLTKSCLVSRDLACAIATSFLRIAGVLADTNLFYDCQALYSVDNSLEGPWTPVQNHFAAQYIAAAVHTQGPYSDAVLTALEAFSSDLKQRNQILASAVQVLAPVNASLAYTLYLVARQKGVEPDPGVTYTLAISFARRGAFCEAILCVNDGQFSPEKRGILVSTMARSLRENPRACQSSRAFVAMVDELVALYHSHAPPEHFRGHLEQLCVVLAQHGRGRQLLPVVLSIFKRLPSFFQSRFFVRYCHALIRHRQLATARKLLDAITPSYPKIVRSFCILVGRIALPTRVLRGYERTTPLRDPRLLRLSSRLRHRPCPGLPVGPSLQELLRSGRVLAAKRIFVRAAANIPSKRCTILGNILLHGVSRQPTSRNGRRVRKVLALLEDLVKNHGFQPDRVTANILIKAMVNWRSAFDSPRLRELFDQLVRGGYPAGDHSSLYPPFGTHRTQSSGSSGFSKLSPSISFEKHTRPLFKMFIKAFYLCNDVEAARKVVGILKVEEYKHIVAREARQRARLRGRVKADQRNVSPLDATVSSID